VKSVLVVHDGTEGHGAAVAAFVADALNARAVKVERVDADARTAAEVQPIHSAAILCAMLAGHAHRGALQRFVRENREWLAGIPVAFIAAVPFSSLEDVQAGQGAHAAAEAYFRKTDWSPAITRIVGVAQEPGSDGVLRRVLRRLSGGASAPSAAAPEGAAAVDRGALADLVDEFLEASSQQEGGH
jgi:menaquinone-dependent protoporphyrinogen IX oxidase